MIILPASLVDAVSEAYLSDDGWALPGDNHVFVRSFELPVLNWWNSLTEIKEVRVQVEKNLATLLIKCRGMVSKYWIGDVPPKMVLFGGVCFAADSAFAIMTVRQPPNTWQEVRIEGLGWVNADPPIFQELEFKTEK